MTEKKSVRPLEGVFPRFLWEEDVVMPRVYDLIAGIGRYEEANFAIPEEWLEELNDLKPISDRFLQRFKHPEMESMTYPLDKYIAGGPIGPREWVDACNSHCVDKSERIINRVTECFRNMFRKEADTSSV